MQVFVPKNISFDDPPKRGHFSCGKLVPHLRTSTVHCLFLWQMRNALFDVGMCMGMVWMDLIDQVTCFGPVEGLMATFGWNRRQVYFDPAKATFIAPLGVEHFFDAFALEHKRDIRVDAAIALELDSEDIPVVPHEAVPEVSKGKVHITQNKHVPIEWFVTTASQSRI